MSTATVQQIGQDFATWLGIAQRGDTVAIVDNGEIIAQLGPPTDRMASTATTPRKSMADWLGEQDRRMQSTFGNRVIADSAPLLEDLRTDRE